MAITNPKTLNVRIKNKYDSYENWAASGLVLEAGEIAIAHSSVDVEVDNGVAKQPVLLMKVGNGTDTFKDLPWLSAKAADVLEAAKDTDKLTAFINGVIADAGIASSDAMEALAGRVTTAEGKITTLEGEMDAVEAKAAANETAIGTLNGLVGDTKVADQISAAIAALDLANTYEAKGEAAKVQTALNEYKTANDAAVQKNATDIAGEISRAKAAEEANTNAINAIKDGTSIDSFKDVEEALAGKQATGDYATKAEAQAMADGKDAAIAAAKTAGDDAAAAAKAAQDDVDAVEALVGDKAVATQIEEAIAAEKLAETYAPISHKHTKSEITDFAHNHEIAEVNGLETALAGKQAVGDYATKTEAQGYANAKDEAIAAAQAAADKAQEEVDALEVAVGAVPEGKTVMGIIDEKTSGIATDAALGELQDAVDAIEADYLKKADKEALQGGIDALEGLVGDTKVADQISTAVAAEKQRAEGIEGGLETRLAAVEEDYLTSNDKEALQTQIDTIMSNPDAEGAINSINEFTQYVKDHGTIAEGFRVDIDANADAIEAVEGRMDTAEGKITALETASATHALKTEVEAVAGRVTTVEGKVTTLEEEMDAVEGRAAALEGLVGDTSVDAQIDAAIEALKIGDYAKAADMTAAINQHNTDKAALEAEIAKKADDSALAAIAKSGNVNDLIQTAGDVLVFDCGGAE